MKKMMYFYTSLLITSIGFVSSDNSSPPQNSVTYLIEEDEIIGDIKEVGSTIKIVDLSNVNTKAGNLLGSYLGIKGEIPDVASINFTDNLRIMWNKKLNIKNVTPATVKSANGIVEEYANNDPKTKSINQFINDINVQLNAAKESLDFDQYCDDMKMNSEQCATTKQIMWKFNGKHLAAYGMTEVMPTKNGKINFAILDTLLRYAGENYINSIPALGDKFLSKGFYQFTSYAIRHDDNRIEGASIVNKFSNHKIGSSVVSLTSEDSHKAAFYFALYNMSKLVKKLNHNEMNIATKCSTEEMIQFVATAHHLPAVAIKNANQWISNGCKKGYTTYAGPKLTQYAEKTESNLNALNGEIK